MNIFIDPIKYKIGNMWHQLNDEQKVPFMQEANRLRDEHKVANPGYRYQPKRRYKRIIAESNGDTDSNPHQANAAVDWSKRAKKRFYDTSDPTKQVVSTAKKQKRLANTTPEPVNQLSVADNINYKYSSTNPMVHEADRNPIASYSR